MTSLAGHWTSVACIQDTLSSRTALGRVRRASKSILHTKVSCIQSVACVSTRYGLFRGMDSLSA